MCWEDCVVYGNLGDNEDGAENTKGLFEDGEGILERRVRHERGVRNRVIAESVPRLVVQLILVGGIQRKEEEGRREGVGRRF